MFEELNNRRKAVEENIVKSFVDDNDIEKARQKKQFNIGDTFTRHGITYRCTGISSTTGRPTWSKVKDSDGIKPEVGKYVDLDSRSSWDDIWNAAKEVAEKWWDEDGSKVNGDKTKEEFVREKMNSICFGFSASVPKKTVIANINTIHQHLEKLKEQKPKEEKQNKSKLNIVSSATYIYAKDKDGNLYVLAGRRGSTAPTGANKLNPPMGMIDHGETPEESAIREIEEETGLKINKKDLIDNGEEEYANRKGVGGKNYSVMLSGDISKYKIGEGDGENSKFTWVKVEDIKDEDWAFGTGGTAKKFKPKKDSEEMKNISDLQVGDEVTIVTDNRGEITKKKGKITSMTSSAYEINGDRTLRFQRRTGGHVGMNNVKIIIS